MPAKAVFPLVAILIGWITLASGQQLDHRTSSNLQTDLLEQSKHGLALARPLLPASYAVEIRHFDGRTEIIHPTCCPKAGVVGISRNRLVVLDAAATPLALGRDAAEWARNVPQWGGHVVAMDMRGRIVARSQSEFLPSDPVLSSDRGQFAVVSVPRGFTQGMGIYIARFTDTQARKVADISLPTSSNAPYTVQTMVDWSPNGQSLLLSHQGSISVVELRTGTMRKIAEGRAALWSPSGELISYITLQWEPAILNVSTSKRTLIDPGNQSSSPLEWSPDGKYLLVPEGGNWFGHLWVYRVADKAWYPIPEHYGTAGPRPHWVELEN